MAGASTGVPARPGSGAVPNIAAEPIPLPALAPAIQPAAAAWPPTGTGMNMVGT